MEAGTKNPHNIDQAVPPEPMPDKDVPFEPALEAEEVDFDEAAAEAAQPDKPKEEKEDVLDILVPKAEIRVWKFGSEDTVERQWEQKPLSFIAKMQWFALIGDVLDQAMSGPNALSVSQVLDRPGQRGTSLTLDDFRDADTFVQGVGKILVHAPDFLIKSYCIWLGVPPFERDLAFELMQLPPEEGGLTDAAGLEIIEVFIDQNAEALTSFFREKLPQIQRRIQARVAEQAEASSGK